MDLPPSSVTPVLSSRIPSHHRRQLWGYIYPFSCIQSQIHGSIDLLVFDEGVVDETWGNFEHEKDHTEAEIR